MNPQKFQALSVLLFPIVLAIGILLIPVVPDYADHDVAGQAAGQTGRWFWGHLLSAVAFGIGAMASGVIVSRLAEEGTAGWRVACMPLMAVGGALYAAGLGADGIGPLAAAAGGGQARLFFDGSGMWVTGTFIAGSMLFGIGLVLQVLIVLRADIIKSWIRVLLFPATLVFLLAPTIPSGWGLYGIVVSALVIYLPIGRAIMARASIMNVWLIKCFLTVAALLLLTPVVYIMIQDGRTFWPHALAGRGALVGILVGWWRSAGQTLPLSWIRMVQWGTVFGSLGGFWCCVTLQGNTMFDWLTMISLIIGAGVCQGVLLGSALILAFRVAGKQTRA